ncbi:hypothetical protein E2320_020004, partial [Naja naja]
MYVIDLRIRNEKIPQIKQMQAPKVQIGLSVPLASWEEKEVALFLKIRNRSSDFSLRVNQLFPMTDLESTLLVLIKLICINGAFLPFFLPTAVLVVCHLAFKLSPSDRISRKAKENIVASSALPLEGSKWKDSPTLYKYRNKNIKHKKSLHFKIDFINQLLNYTYRENWLIFLTFFQIPLVCWLFVSSKKAST